MDNQWRKSTRSGGNGQCVEARQVGHTAEVRDSKDQSGPVLAFGPEAWSAFVDGLKSSK
jgi:hypothetical protein